jgi:hypothetical protein
MALHGRGSDSKARVAVVCLSPFGPEISRSSILSVSVGMVSSYARQEDASSLCRYCFLKEAQQSLVLASLAQRKEGVSRIGVAKFDDINPASISEGGDR